MTLEVRGLRVSRGGRTVLHVPHLAVSTGEVLAIVGPNGAGKSSLLQSIGLLIQAHFDTYAFEGRPIRLPTEGLSVRRKMAMVMQEPLLLDTTVLENVASGLILRGTPRRDAYGPAERWLARLEIAHLADRLARRLSGGEAQRVSIARALVLTPRLLLLDEPFAALDVFSRGALLKELRPLLREKGTTALLVTHDIAEVAHLADRVAVMEAGRIVQIGTTEAVLHHPQTHMLRQMRELARDTAAVLAPLTRSASMERSDQGDQ